MNTETLVPRKAEKKRVKLKMAVQGPSGSGKTWGALALAKNLWPDAKVCVVDTENESASLYADRFDFDTIPLGPPFTTARYIQCIDASVKGGYDVLILDSITAQWDGEGGILRRKEELERRSPGANGYVLWAQFTPEHEKFKQAILQAPVHVIATMRSKQEYALQANDKGKQVPVKMGLAPIQRDQIDYEFALVFDVQGNHIAVASKDRTGLFNEKTADLADPKTADAIRTWLDSGKEAPPVAPAVEPPPEAARRFEFIPPNTLICTVRGIQPRMKDNRPYLLVTFNGYHATCNFASCFDTGLHEAINAGLDKECQFQLVETDSKGIHYLRIADVLKVGDVEYSNGKPITPKGDPDGHDDIFADSSAPIGGWQGAARA